MAAIVPPSANAALTSLLKAWRRLARRILRSSSLLSVMSRLMPTSPSKVPSSAWSGYLVLE
ncbi:hypothetical protein D3C72_2069720 [compost metagenome]